MIAAVLVVVGVIVLLVVLTSRGGSGERTPSSQEGNVGTRPVAPTSASSEEEPAAYPPLSPDLRKTAEKLAAEAKELAKEGDRLYAEAGEAKNRGDDDEWQDKLQEASQYFQDINDGWNELIETIMAEIGDGGEYDAEQVANHYFGNEAEVVRRAGRRLAAINKDRR